MHSWLRRTRTALAAVAIAAALSAAYSNSFRVPFLLDDNLSIVNNRTLRQLRLIWPVLTPPGHGTTVSGRPVLNVSFAANYALGGLDVVGYHAANLAVHAAAALTLFGLARRTLGLPGIPDRLAGRATGLALAAALLWGLHPLQTESVTYIAQRAEALGGLLYLLVFYCTVRGAVSPRPGAWYAGAAGVCLLGVAAKETVATAPILLMLFDRIYLSPSWGEVRRRRGKLYAAMLTSWVLLGFLVWSAKGRGGTVGGEEGLTPLAYAATQFGFIVRYLVLTVWPADLVFDYGVYVARDPGEILPPAILVAVLIAITSAGLWWRPRVGFLGVAFFALLAPTSTVLPINTQTGAEHRMYLALAPLCVLAVLGTAYLLPPRSRHSGVALGVIFTAACLALGWRTHTRNEDYRSLESICSDTVAKWPRGSRGYIGLSAALATQGRFDEALARSEEAEAVSRAAGAAVHRAILQKAFVLWKAGRPDDAGRAFDEAVAADPGPLSLAQRGKFLMASGRTADAINDFTAALSRSPDDAQVLSDRGRARYQLGRLDEARADFDRAAELDPYDPLARLQRGDLNLRLGRFQAAADDFTAAARLDDSLPDAYLGRAQVALAERRVADAAADVERAAGLNPDLHQVYYLRGVLAWTRRDPARAITELSEAIRREPSFEVAYRLRAACHLALGDKARAREDAEAVKRLGGTPGPALTRLLEEPR